MYMIVDYGLQHVYDSRVQHEYDSGQWTVACI